jgi:hypothetical protein
MRSSDRFRVVIVLHWCLAAVGLLACVYGLLFVPAQRAAILDAVLTPAELKDPVKINAVSRTLEHREPMLRRAETVCGSVGAAVLVMSSLCLFFLTRDRVRGGLEKTCPECGAASASTQETNSA